MALGRNIRIYGWLALLVLGTVGNTLSGVIMMRRRLRKYTSSLYFLCLAVSDTLTLYTGAYRILVWDLFGVSVVIMSSIACKLQTFFALYMVQVEAWILVCVAVERLAAVWWPLKIKLIFTRKLILVQMLVIVLVLGLVNAHLFWTEVLVTSDVSRACVSISDRAMAVGRWSYAVLATILPITIMITCSVLIVVKIQLRKLRRASGPATSGTALRIVGITAILLSVCAVFVITTLPIKVVMIKLKMLGALYGCCFMKQIIVSLLFLFQFSNYAINFLLYCVSSSNIRNELKSMFCHKSTQASPHVAQQPVNLYQIGSVGSHDAMSNRLSE
jgi:hypothetical protein